ncbi:MAG: dihydrodipicolinate synthase family protein [Acidobacteriaceae bacterium]|nr:dihydrodipicolinate synthase family protein [Acidobacteriaceae bacterium]
MLKQGTVIPAHPLALNAQRKLDERRQVALTRYYCQAGVQGIAAGVHTTQFAIRDPRFGLFKPVLRLVASTVMEFQRTSGKRLIKVAGLCGQTKQAVGEAEFAREAGFELGLLSLTALAGANDAELIEHCRRVGRVLPLFGFYLQPAVGGRVLSYNFWREFCEIEAVAAIKIAPFNRYQTLDVVRAVADSGRGSEIVLYTGNDDNIIPDLLADFRLDRGVFRFAGGLLGQWAVWTKCAVELLYEVQNCRSNGGRGAFEILANSAALTDANAALFDARNQFAGCIPGLHEILRRQGLLAGRWCLDPDEDLSPGQLDEIDRVCASYPDLQDDDFVRSNLDRWLA